MYRDMGLRMLLLLHIAPCFYAFRHHNPYILQHFGENVFTLVSLVFPVLVAAHVLRTIRMIVLQSSTSIAYNVYIQDG